MSSGLKQPIRAGRPQVGARQNRRRQVRQIGATPRRLTPGVLAFLGALALSACATSSPERAALERAYRQPQAAPELLDAFFRQWEEELPALTAAEIAALPAVQRAVYEVFATFYTPDDLERLGGWNDYVHDVPYYAVQGAVDYEVVDRLLPPYKVRSADSGRFFTPRVLEAGRIEDFRPRLEVGDKRVVFLSAAYDAALRGFLEKRGADLLSDRITVSPGHWGGWEVSTFPTVILINLDETLTEASLSWWIGPDTGEAFFRRTDSGWEMTLSEVVAVT